MNYASSLLGLLPGGRRTPGLKELLASVGTYLPPEQVARIREAAEFGTSAHRGQKRLSGEPFIAHPVAAAAILADLRLDADTIVAAILHDVIEDTPTPKDQLAARFGADVAELVDGVTKLDQIKFKSREEAQAESFRKMLLAMVRDLRVILVKLADRMHNMRTIAAMAPARRRAIARETLEIYAPIAERLGLYNIKLELEDLGFEALYPRRYQVLEHALRRARGNQKEFLKKIEQQLNAALLKSSIQAHVVAREKHLYSIYSKMRRKRAMLNEIVDVYGIRIVVDSPDTCYRALGAVHSVFKPMPARVKDDMFPDKVYVFTPKGQILRLPSGATVVDFAYAVHTDIGNRCVAAKLDRRLTPLRTVLRNGQTVEIITAKGATPNPSWVNFVVTAKARSAIRHYLKSLRRSEAIALGSKLLAQALGEFSVSLDDVLPEVQRAALGELGMKDLDELYEKLGMGERLAPLVARRLLPSAAAASGAGGLAPLAIAGTEGLLVTYARCCFPIPYDPIFAFLSAGRGVVIHRQNCGNVEDYRKPPENWLPVSWQTAPDRLFSSEIRVYVVNRTGVLAAVAAAIASTETNIDHVSIDEQDSDTAVLTFELRLRDRRHLARLVRVIRRMPDVTRVTRTIAARARSERTADGEADSEADNEADSDRRG